MSMFDLSSRTAVVVGGTSGIGRVVAPGFADAGADAAAFVTGDVLAVDGGFLANGVDQ